MPNLFAQYGGLGGMPKITPKAPVGGGDARPPYLQMRNPTNVSPAMASYQGASKPVVTPKSMVQPNENVNRLPAGVAGQATPGGAPAISPPGTYTAADAEKFGEQQLANQAKLAAAAAKTDAANRGVYYGTPLTGSLADINTQFLQGLGQYKASVFQNQQQNELERLRLASELSGQAGAMQPPPPGPIDWSSLAAAWGNPNSVASKRTGPAVTEKDLSGQKKDVKKDINKDEDTMNWSK